MDHTARISRAADLAVFYFQFPTRDAVKYVCRQVPGCTEDQARGAVRQSATFHR